MEAWWEHELIDRPVISYFYPKKRGKLGGYLDVMGEDWSLAENFDGIVESLTPAGMKNILIEAFLSRPDLVVKGAYFIFISPYNINVFISIRGCPGCEAA